MTNDRNANEKVQKMIDVDENDLEKIDVCQNHVNRDSENNYDKDKDNVIHLRYKTKEKKHK